MTYLTHSLLFFFSCLSLLLCVSNAGSRPVHGPAYTNPSAFSPEAYDFFHPKSSIPDHNNPPENSPSSPSTSPTPSPSKTSIVEADSQGSKVSSDEHTTSESRRREDEEGRGETIGVVLGLSFAAFLSLGIYFVIKKRRARMIRTIVTHSDA
ncbi:PREDICTED: proline-rich receptor-like protein kinase PERK8 [Camelina sativa]|uniref:Proline-rich receptor-like protein kinase PERK8 n=1 Tax=Camelina sativa TaxID=90675 RepID=A0ABM0XC12_CAMSA|nr:PREDICTED: proline-rich receptor-like protein kinase PERK8 [Camelina sativa]